MSKNKPGKQFSELWDPHGEEIKSHMLLDEGINIKNGKILDLKQRIYRF